jgi:hypothetical protein
MGTMRQSKLLLWIVTLCLLMAGLPACAQTSNILPTPDAVAADNSEDEIAPLDQATSSAQKGIPQDLLQEHLEFRQKEREENGFNWVPWSDVGDKVRQLVLSRDPDVFNKDDKMEYIDVAIEDVDTNGEPDIILNFWEPRSCGTQGCRFKIFFDSPLKDREYFIGWLLQPYKEGIKLDGTYFSL